MSISRTPFDTVYVKHVSDVLKTVKIPDFQRESDMIHIENIYNGISSQLKNNREPKLTGCLITVSTEAETYLLDGNHRLKAFKRLLEEGHDLKIYVQELKASREEAEELFNQTNTCLPVAEMPQGIKRSSVNEVTAYFYKKYGSTPAKREPLFRDTPSSVVNRPRISRSKFETAVGQILELGFSPEEFIRKLDEHIAELNGKSLLYFKHSSNDTYKKLQDMLDIADIFGCRLGMYFTQNYFKDLSTLMGVPEQKDINDVPLVRTKSKIPQALRISVWNRYCGQTARVASCFFCNTEIKIESFHCAHDTADALGGDINIDNLYPCCATCNLSMGMKSFEEFQKKFKASCYCPS
jgi:hypothetical protein